MIRYHLPQAARVRLAVYNATGQQVRMLMDGWQEAGEQRLVWDGRDEAGNNLSTGVYLVQLRMPTQTRSIKVLLVKSFTVQTFPPAPAGEDVRANPIDHSRECRASV
ncbi:MAG: hypothetical protein ONB48_09850 [candidate division KSB1 bacterium]|nr:hypothetical protein [candidate division KSB1 bacterium]MDZ7273791.1 hypothetical protein [candidate division KSB1 bacterium]MDZ7285947.1 hypothetical protein [candidate division KSB1 bacterium]MDZ7298979.1 hypothetical protein [candidate division KSB1 bacterium]MDZ7309359.1 hypothetical protein [candidate division KSB1 bacterium]